MGKAFNLVEYFQDYYKYTRFPTALNTFLTTLTEESSEAEAKRAKWDLIEHYMLASNIISTDPFGVKLGNCIKELVDNLNISEEEAVDTICRALYERRICLKNSDLNVENHIDQETNIKIAEYIRMLKSGMHQRANSELLKQTHISFVNTSQYNNTHYVKGMLYLLKEEKMIRKNLEEELKKLEGRVENLYARFLELAGILIAIFSVIGFNLLSIKDGIAARTVVIINCMIVFTVSGLSLLIELLFMREKVDRRIIIVGVVCILSCIMAILLA